MTIRVLIADDHGIVRQGLRMYLQFDPELEVVGEAANGKEALELTEKLHPDIILMDLLMPQMDGLEATAAVRRAFPETEVLALTSVLDDTIIHRAIRAGAIGYLLKDTGSDELCRAIHAAVGGQVQLSRQVAQRMATEQEDTFSIASLTDRETDVLRQIACGRSNKEIALNLNIAEKTVKAHVGSILDKLGVASRTQAALLAIRFGLVQSAEETRK
ncbi:MAG: response regulator transcription factor [Chloroflexi bacterium]|nr:response regulator transcription factor [Chloroflexota bacterium]